MNTPWFNYFLSEARAAVASGDVYSLREAFLAGYRSGYLTSEMTEQCLAVLSQPYDKSTQLLDLLVLGDYASELSEWAYLYTPLFEGSDVRRPSYAEISKWGRSEHDEHDDFPCEADSLWENLTGGDSVYPFSYLFMSRSEILDMWVATKNDQRLTRFIQFFVLLDALNPLIISRRAKVFHPSDIYRRWCSYAFYYQVQNWPSIDLPDDTEGRTPEQLLALYASRVDLSFITDYA